MCIVHVVELGLFLRAVCGAPRSPCSTRPLGPGTSIIGGRGVLLPQCYAPILVPVIISRVEVQHKVSVIHVELGIVLIIVI
jgi:hypothetical protein